MKSILRIFVILLVAGLVAGGLTLVVNNSFAGSIPQGGPQAAMQGGERPAIDGQPGQFADRGEGGEQHAASLGRGLLDMLLLVTKITMVTCIVLLVGKVVSLCVNRRSARAPQRLA